MVINKQQGSTPVSVDLTNFETTGTAQAWQIASATQSAIIPLGNIAIAKNAIATTVPSQSITLFVIPAGNVIVPPPPPTGLVVTVGNHRVRLTWLPDAGASTYSIYRGTSPSSYSKIAIVSSPATSFQDAGLTNGTTYYYMLTASNSAGTSPSSVSITATPMAPPVFTSSATASPNPVAQGASTTVTAKVTCTAHSLANGIVQVLVIDPSGNTAASQNFTGQNFATGTSQNYQLTLQPALAGTYTVEAGVFSSTWQQWSWNASAGTITVTSSLTFTSSATAIPSTIASGGTSNISASVTDTGSAGLTNGIVEIQIFNQSGSAVATTYWTGQNFSGGQNIPYQYSLRSTSGLAAGVYTVAIGVFNSTWSTNYYWNGSAASITVTP
jgi:hypothetical protein